jgi:hypothetical protein
LTELHTVVITCWGSVMAVVRWNLAMYPADYSVEVMQFADFAVRY